MSKIKQYFTSRWGEDGVIMEADFSQLEIIYLAHITKDPNLIADIKSGVDLHIVRAAEMYGIPEHEVTKGQRKLAKAFSFQLQYGSGAAKMAEETGASIEEARKFISNYYARYPEVEKWQNKQIEKVSRNGKLTHSITPIGFQRQKSTIQSETGRKYTFWSDDAPEYLRRKLGVETTFKPTKIKNYPIQGGATGDIVPMVLGRMYRWLIEEDATDDVKLIGTVHDSIILDIRKDMAYNIGCRVKRLMEDAPNMYEEVFGVKFELPLKVEVTYGPNWLEQSEEIK